MAKRKKQKNPPGLRLNYRDGERVEVEMPDGSIGQVYFEILKNGKFKRRRARFLFPNACKITAESTQTT